MCDFTSLALPELRARMHDCMARRLDAETVEDRSRSGDELLRVLDELSRRGCLHRGASARDAMPAVDDVPSPRAGTAHAGAAGLLELVLDAPGSGSVPTPARLRSATD
jgi:hypothetical protein